MTVRYLTATWLVGITLLGVAPAASALHVGESCVLKSPLPVTFEQGRNHMDALLEPGTEVSVVYVGDNGRSRISNGALRGVVVTREFDAACAGTLRLCTATAPLTLYERNRSDSPSTTIVRRSMFSILRAGKVWAHLSTADREGFALVTDAEARCGRRADDDNSPDGSKSARQANESRGPVVEDVDRGDGPGVLVLPFVIDEGAPAARADQLAAGFFEHLAYYRPDVGRLPLLGSRSVSWKEHVETAVRRARATGHAYALLGRLSLEGSQAVVSLAVIDVESGKTLKGVRARPKSDGADDWSEPALAALLPVLKPAPGSRQPRARGAQTTSGDGNATPNAPRFASSGEGWGSPWFLNPWGYAAFGVGVASGVGAYLIGQQALDTNALANTLAATDESRGERRREALQQAVLADSLTVAAAAAGVTGVVVFVGRVGLGE
jgi:TolB-like protein